MRYHFRKILASAFLAAGMVFVDTFVGFAPRNQAVSSAETIMHSNVVQYGARLDAATAYINKGTTGAPDISVAGRFSAADIAKDILVYAPLSPSTPGYKPNIFTGCIQHVSGAGTIRLGVWRGKTCLPASYPGQTVTSAYPTFIYGHDSTEALQAAVDTLEPGKQLVLDGTVIIHDTITFRNKTGGEFRGITMNGQVRQVPFTGSNIVWAGPAGKPMFRFENTGGMYIHDLHFVGNSYPQSRPSALIDIGQSAGALPANRFQGISNMYGSAFDSAFDTADNGIYIESHSNRTADKFTNIRLFNLGLSCFNNQNSEASQLDFSNVTCQHVPVGLYCVNGGRVSLSGATEIITVGQIFHLGGGCSVSAVDVEPENDSPGEEGITQLAYFEKGNGGNGGGSLSIGRGGFGPVSKLPTAARASFLGHRLTPNALVDTDTSAPVNLELGAFGFYFTAQAKYAYRRPSPWLVHLPSVGGPSVHTFRCQLCLGLGPSNIDLYPGGYMQSRNTIEIINMPGFGAPSLFVRQVLSGNQRFNPNAGGIF